MNPMSREADFERIEDEASVWAARLHSGAMTDADREALAAWLEQDPERRWVLSRYRELTAQLDRQLGAGAEPPVEAEFAVQRRRWRRWTMITAAAAAIVIMAVVLIGRPQEFATKTAERHLAALADGSRVELNARTVLTVDFGKAERRVRLAHGEALFSVAKDPARPFVVETPAGAVRVTGTVFNVRTATAERVEVTVLEGTVRVQPEHAAEKTATLTADKQALLGGESVDVHTLPTGGAQDVTAWRQGQAVFEDTPLADAIERFAAYHARTMSVDPAAADLRLGGRYSLDDLDGFLSELQRVLPVRMVLGEKGAVRIVPAR